MNDTIELKIQQILSVIKLCAGGNARFFKIIDNIKKNIGW